MQGGILVDSICQVVPMCPHVSASETTSQSILSSADPYFYLIFTCFREYSLCQSSVNHIMHINEIMKCVRPACEKTPKYCYYDGILLQQTEQRSGIHCYIVANIS